MSLKITKSLLAVISAVLLGVIWFFGGDTDHPYVPEYENNTVKSGDFYFSAAPGFYDSEFDLTIVAPTDEIYYTLDGSEPDRNSIRYSGAIHISDATDHENVYSIRTDTTAGFLKEEIESSQDAYELYANEHLGITPLGRVTAPDYKVPNYKVDKCSVIRAVYYQNDEKSEMITGTYFVGFSDKTGYDGISVVSVTLDPDDLFDYNDGIYVTGDCLDEFIENGGLQPENVAAHYWWWWDANYRQHGKKWERAASVQFYNENHELVLSQQAGVRTQGGGSRGYVQKSLNLYAREDYDGNDVFHYDFWGNGYLQDKITLTSCGDDYYSKIQDRITYDLSEEAECDFVYMHYKPCMLFLDGEFWGFYYIADSVDADSISKRYGVSEDNVTIVKGASLEDGNSEDFEAFQKIIHFLENVDMTEDSNYEKVWELLDKDSTIDYLAVELYAGRYNDWKPAMGNSALWRVHEVEDGNYGNGKWRFIIFDMNSGGLTGLDTDWRIDVSGMDTVDNIRKTSRLFDNLCNNASFQQDLANRMIELGQGSFSAENADRQIAMYQQEMQDAMKMHMKRFYGADNDEYEIETASVNAFFDKRYDCVVKMLEKNFPDISVNTKQD